MNETTNEQMDVISLSTKIASVGDPGAQRADRKMVLADKNPTQPIPNHSNPTQHNTMKWKAIEFFIASEMKISNKKRLNSTQPPNFWNFWVGAFVGEDDT